ncbi:MAG: hypothetical protein WCS83_05480 [Endomicrobiia bacterium]|nr:hypothetical protein [Endomicrobiaceae bacterium]
MKKILVISQKELVQEPVFRQDKNLIEMLDILMKENEVEHIYLHKIVKNAENEVVYDSKFDDIKKFCLRDMMQKNSLKKNITKLIMEKGYDSIVFMSYYMAQLIMPYIDEISDNINIIVDFRLSRIEHVLQQYQEEKQKNYSNCHPIYKDFKINFLQTMAIFAKSDFCILDKENDITLLSKNKIKNIITIDQVSNSLQKQIKAKQEQKIVEIKINNSNFNSKSNIHQEIEMVKKNKEYIINYSKNSNLINNINDVISKNDADYFCFYNEKLKILPKTNEIISKYFAVNDNIALISPSITYAQGFSLLQLQSSFDEQRYNNFTNWEECQPLFFSECFILKKEFVKKIGYLDNKFETINYALFDFIVRLYRVGAYFFVMKDIPVFKTSAAKQPISLFKKDKSYLCNKWGEFDFSF